MAAVGGEQVFKV